MQSVQAIPENGAGKTTLQVAYDNDPTGAQIVLDTVPNPITIQAAVAGTIFSAIDLGGNGVLTVSADPDTVLVEGGLEIEDSYLNATAAASIIMRDTVSVPAFVGGGIQSLGTITYTASTFIWALLQESKGYIANAGPGFAAFTLFNAIPFIRNGTNAGLVQALTLNVGISHQVTGAVAATTVGTTGVSFSPNTRALSAFGSMTKTSGDTALRVSPTFGTVGSSSINFGTIRGVHCLNPTVALFQPQAGTESMTAYVGMDIEAITFGGNVTKRGVRSFLTNATNTRFIDGQGSAQSDLRGTLNFPVDLIGIQYGASLDWFEAWAGGGFKIEQQASPLGQFRKSFPTTARMLFDWSVDMELTINAALGFSLGAQSGANGNQFGNFVTAARTIPVGGDWADFLLTQGGNLTVGGLAMGRVSAWVINPISYANSTGSVGEADTLTVGGFPTSSPGVTITERQSLNVIGGRSRFSSAMQFEPINPAALAAGNNNDWAGLLTGSANNGMRHWVRVTPDGGGGSVLTGIDSTAAQDGDSFILTNIGTVNFAINHNDGSSSAGNRILTYTVANLTVGPNESVFIIYDATTGAWRAIYGSAA